MANQTLYYWIPFQTRNAAITAFPNRKVYINKDNKPTIKVKSLKATKGYGHYKLTTQKAKELHLI